MPSLLSAPQLLNRDFLEIRTRLLDIAAALDRIERGDSAAVAAKDARLAKVREAAGLLFDGHGSRTERIQMVFSLDYAPNWRASP